MNCDTKHLPVLCEELIQALHVEADPAGVFVDATAGYGGHAALVWQKLAPQGTLVLCDQDPHAIAHLTERFQSLEARARVAGHSPPTTHITQRPFSQLPDYLAHQNLVGKVRGLYADLGVSSPQLDEGARGFSVRKTGPLDMRMNPDAGISAQEFLQQVSHKELTQILKRYGEEPRAWRIAAKILADRAALRTTTDLARIVTEAKGPAYGLHRKRIHPATQTFQALRMHLNREQEELMVLLESSLPVLAPGGVWAMISFHSLEDRLVKRRFQALAKNPASDHHHDFHLTAHSEGTLPSAAGTLVRPFPMKASSAEMARNRRARSARLRIFRKKR